MPILVNKEVATPPPTIHDLETSMISNKTIDGILDKATPIINGAAITQTNTATNTTTAAELKPDQKEPEFPGGGAGSLAEFFKKKFNGS